MPIQYTYATTVLNKETAAEMGAIYYSGNNLNLSIDVTSTFGNRLRNATNTDSETHPKYPRRIIFSKKVGISNAFVGGLIYKSTC